MPFQQRLTKISKIKTRINPSKSNSILKKIDVRGCLEALQKDFALAPIDKASNSAVIIHKRCYVEVILNEIGVIGHGHNT